MLRSTAQLIVNIANVREPCVTLDTGEERADEDGIEPYMHEFAEHYDLY
jgi:hypothetical protein